MPTIFSAAIVGIEAAPVRVEADVANGLPQFSIVGLPDKSIQEARERVRVAITNSGLPFPKSKIVVNLAPADIKKEGPRFDLAIALAILAAEGVLVDDERRRMFLGELAFDGTIRPVMGALPTALAARRGKFDELLVPAENAAEAALAESVPVIPVRSLSEAVMHLRGEVPIAAVARTITPATPHTDDGSVDFSHIRGQLLAKRAMEIAAAGMHNVLLTGSPGAGKSMLAKALPTILPPMSDEEKIEVTTIHSVAGRTSAGVLFIHRPFRSPHHTTSGIALIGGGQWPKPGEVSLAHRGVLFLDELPEFGRSALENLRQPIEDGVVTVARANSTVRFPAAFMLVAARNPCPCGYAGDNDHPCVCPPAAAQRYGLKISGPLLDRIDLQVKVERVPVGDLFSSVSAEPSSAVASRVIAAREIQIRRFNDGAHTNARMDRKDIEQFCTLDKQGDTLLRQAAQKMKLSARAVMRALKVARTIADLSATAQISSTHLAEALHFREMEMR